jgi:hypothetical protein
MVLQLDEEYHRTQRVRCAALHETTGNLKSFFKISLLKAYLNIQLSVWKYVSSIKWSPASCGTELDIEWSEPLYDYICSLI